MHEFYPIRKTHDSTENFSLYTELFFLPFPALTTHYKPVLIITHFVLVTGSSQLLQLLAAYVRLAALLAALLAARVADVLNRKVNLLIQFNLYNSI